MRASLREVNIACGKLGGDHEVVEGESATMKLVLTMSIAFSFNTHRREPMLDPSFANLFAPTDGTTFRQKIESVILLLIFGLNTLLNKNILCWHRPIKISSQKSECFFSVKLFDPIFFSKKIGGCGQRPQRSQRQKKPCAERRALSLFGRVV